MQYPFVIILKESYKGFTKKIQILKKKPSTGSVSSLNNNAPFASSLTFSATYAGIRTFVFENFKAQYRNCPKNINYI